jgi:hypothetical protein
MASDAPRRGMPVYAAARAPTPAAAAAGGAPAAPGAAPPPPTIDIAARSASAGAAKREHLCSAPARRSRARDARALVRVHARTCARARASGARGASCCFVAAAVRT